MEQVVLTQSKAKAKVKEFAQESTYSHFSVSVTNGSTFLAYGADKNTITDREQIEEREKQRCKDLRIPYPSHDIVEPKIKSSSMVSMFRSFLETFEHPKIEIGTDRGAYCLLACPEKRTVEEMLEEIRKESEERMERLEQERLDAEEKRVAQNNSRHIIIEEEEDDDDDTPEEDRPLNLKKVHSKQRVGRDEARDRMDSLDWDDITHKVQNNLVGLSDIAIEAGVSYAGIRYRLKKMGVL